MKIENPNDPMQKGEKGMNGFFPKEHTQITNNYMKRCPISLIMREMQIKTTIRKHITPSVSKDVKRLCTYYWGDKMEATEENSITVSKIKNKFLYYSEIPLWSTYRSKI